MEVFKAMLPQRELERLRPQMQFVQKNLYMNLALNENKLMPVVLRDVRTSQPNTAVFPDGEDVVVKWKGIKDDVYFDDLCTQLPPPSRDITTTVNTPEKHEILRNSLLNLAFPFTNLSLTFLVRLHESEK